jgi:transposase
MTPRKGTTVGRSEEVADLTVTQRHAAGIDVHAAVHFVAVPVEDVPAGFINPDAKLPAGVRKFGTHTGDLEAIAAWLKECGVRTVAMESTGVDWIPLYELLASQGFNVILVDPLRPSTRRVGPRATCWIVNGFGGCTAAAC